MRTYYTAEDFCILDRKLAIIERYRRKVIPAVKRPRGNPQNVREAMAWILGLDFARLTCECCGSTTKVQLHHRNGVWKDYYVHNLVFICAVCHQAEHNGCWRNITHLQEEEDIMAVIKRTDWNGYQGNDTETRGEKLRRLVKTAGGTVKEACRNLSDQSKEHFGHAIRPQALEAAFYFKRAEKVVGGEPAKAPHTQSQQSQQIVVTGSDADMTAFLRWAVEKGVTIAIINPGK